MRLLVLQHHAAEHPGMFREFLEADGIDWDVVQLQDGDPLPPQADHDALWVMGGPMDVWQETRYPWLAPEKRFIREAVFTHGKPFLGCCLGHQLLAEVAGGECRAMLHPEIGIHAVELTAAAQQDALLAGTPEHFDTLQWHGVAVTQVPPEVTILAQSPVAPIQAIRVGDHAWGLQFHIEAGADTVDEWGQIPEYADALAQTLGKDALATIRSDTRDRLDDLRANARRVYDNFMAAAR